MKMLTRLSFLLLLAIIVINLYLIQVKARHFLLQEYGPRNISRVEGEANVYIPCPFEGKYNLMWKINGIYYVGTKLPRGLIGATYGLFIPEVQRSMNGTTFQCFMPTGDAYEIHESSVGTLSVIELDTEIEPSTHSVSQITLDHQRIFFYEHSKTFAWNSLGGNSCNSIYQVNTTICNDTLIRSWQTNDTRITISSSDITIGSQYIFDNIFFELNAVDNEEQICQEFPEHLVVNVADITEDRPVPLSGLCTDISSLAVPNVVLPKNQSIDLPGQDCVCSILINSPCYDFSTCSCINETIFSKSIFSCKLQKQLTPVYHLCFLNLMTEMNNTVIHIFESYRYCTSSRKGQPMIRFYREYHKSFRIITALPNPPIITIDYETSGINFSSENSDKIQVDYYQVIICDVTRNIFYNDNHTNNHTSISGIFQGSACSPYSVTVQAHNSFGFTENEIFVSQSNEPNDGCLCINQNVIITMALVEETDGILLQVNCSQTRYLDSEIMLKVSAEQDAGTITNVTTTCRNQEIPVGSQCGGLYTIVIYWIKDNIEEIQNECIIEQIAQNLQCTTPDDYTVTIIIATILGSISVVFFIFCILFVVQCVYIFNCRSKYRSYTINAETN